MAENGKGLGGRVRRAMSGAASMVAELGSERDQTKESDQATTAATAAPAAEPVPASPAPGAHGVDSADGFAYAPGEEPWTPEEVTEIRAELHQEALDLRSQLATSAEGLASLLSDSGDGAGDDQADAGAKTFEREHEMSVANNLRDMLAQTERALARMDAGSYGSCESCGEPIGKARLQVFPRATLCRTCKQREERR